MEKIARNIKRFIRTFPKKHHVEYITALLSIPVLLSVVALNLINLQNNSKKDIEAPTAPTQQAQQPIIVEVNPNNERQNVSTPNPEVCTKEIGPIDISAPREGRTVTDDHVCINIVYENENYCSVVWSYRINQGTWSEYNSNSPCLYNLPAGEVKFELRVQSTVSQDTDILERNFMYSPVATAATPTAEPLTE